MKNIIPNNIPFGLHVAAISTQLSYINIQPTNESTGVRTTIKTIKIGDWENRLVRKSSDFVNNDIKNSLANDPNSIFSVFCLGGGFYKKWWIFVCVDLMYKIDSV